MITLGSGQLKSVVITNAITGDPGLEISDIVTEIEIYNSLHVPFKTGKILFTDGRGILDKLRIVGGEIITVLISTSAKNSDEQLIKSTFIVDGIDSMQKTANNSVYLFTLSSIYMYRNMYTRISEHFSGRSSDAIEKILVRTMNNLTAKSEDDAREMIAIEPSKDNVSFIIPNKRLSEALVWIRDKSRSESATPYFIFELIDNSMAYASYGFLIKKNAIATYSKFDTLKTDPQSTYYEIKSIHINKLPNAYDNIVSGMYASKTFAYDLHTKEVKIEKYNINDYQDASDLLNKEQINTGILLDQKVPSEMSDVQHNFTFSTSTDEPSEGVVDNNTEEADMHLNAEKYVPYLKSKRSQINQHQITCGVIGNINIYPGAIVNIEIPTNDLPEVGSDNLDKALSGRYMITNVRHQFTSNKHTTLFECMKDSWI